jgi:thiamine pyrophosphate-dependent acetolactate synthase large subunit-like protein
VQSAGSVRDAAYDVLRQYGMTTLFANPGSTEVPFLAGFPDDLRFVLALHEGSVVGMATGMALASGRPAGVLLHTTAGLGNAVGALATARVNRAPLVVIVGQQDRRHLALEPFLTGRLRGLAGDYPVWVDEPVRAADVPGAIARAWHESIAGAGPALVIVPMDDWAQPMDDYSPLTQPVVIHRAAAADPGSVRELTAALDGAGSPALVVGAGADDPETWHQLVELVERLGCPVYQEAFGARAGFPQDHPRFAGHLPAGRGRLREVLAPYDVLLVVGAPAFRQYPYESGPLVPPTTRLLLVTDNAAEAHRLPGGLAVVAPIPATVALLASGVRARPDRAVPEPRQFRVPALPESGEQLQATHVLAALARRLPPETVLVEEAPSARPNLHALLPARRPMGFLSAAMGGLGFALPAAAGVRMAVPDRPVVAVVGDGSAMYGIQALWSAARYGCGVLYVVLSNGRYSIMDRLAGAQNAKPAWPAFEEVSMSAIAMGLGCPARRITTAAELDAVLDEVVPGLAQRSVPLLLDVVVAPDAQFRADQSPSV